ncbi:MAG TPA: hypothetical protein VN418_00655 [Gammaproteobacteria bacterium]|nr:hypothetical protein [Gammaproteobacteria bacterium]
MEPANRTPQSLKQKSRLWRKLLIVALILVAAGILINLLPRGYSRDLSQIGKVGNVVVQIHDHNQVSSQLLMDQINKVRSDYEGRVTFLVADVYTAEGKAFADNQDIHSAALVFFAANGEKLTTLYGQQDAETIRKTLNETFHY